MHVVAVVTMMAFTGPVVVAICVIEVTVMAVVVVVDRLQTLLLFMAVLCDMNTSMITSVMGVV